MGAMYQQAVLAVTDPATFGAVQGAIDQAFSAARVQQFFKSLQSGGLRVRDFEKVLTSGLLGAATEAEYAKLDNSDQGQIREHYLASLEKVDGELRDKFFKLYAYY